MKQATERFAVMGTILRTPGLVGLGLASLLASSLGCGAAHETNESASGREAGTPTSGTVGSGAAIGPSMDAAVHESVDAGGQSSSSDASASGSAIDAGDSGGWWRPGPGVTWQWQLDGTLDTTLDVEMYDIDMFTNDESTIASLKNRGVVVICYVDVGTYEPDRPDAADFPSAVLGSADPDGQGEYWLDVRSSTVQQIMQKRFELAQSKGCSGIEPDNVDGYENDTGFPLTAADQITYNTWVANAVHGLGMSVALKNDVDQIPQLEPLFDFELDEQCFDYSECNTLLPFIQANKAALEVEYGDAGLVSTICPQANTLKLDTIIKDLDLDAYRVSCH